MRPYSQRFISVEEANAYNRSEYGPGSYSSFIWELERPLLEEILDSIRAEKPEFSLLDFACGNGRITEVAEGYAGKSLGIDISKEMIELARKTCRRSSFSVGDFNKDDRLAAGQYDVITMFRFILNADSDLREGALRWLRNCIQEGSGRLILNMHGNVYSMRHPSIVFRKWRIRYAGGNDQGGRIMLNEMSVHDVSELLQRTGFEIVEYYGVGVMPPLLYRIPVARNIAGWVDRVTTGVRLLRNVSVNVIFVCRPVPDVRG